MTRALDASRLDRRKVVGDTERGVWRSRVDPPRIGGDPGRFRRGQRLIIAIGKEQGPVRILEEKRHVRVECLFDKLSVFLQC